MLLGIASGQEHDIKLMQGDLEIIKERVEHIDQQIDGVDRRLEHRSSNAIWESRMLFTNAH